MPKKGLRIYVKDKKVEASDETTVDKLGIESGVKAEFTYPNYKNYVDVQKVDGAWDEKILEV